MTRNSLRHAEMDVIGTTSYFTWDQKEHVSHLLGSDVASESLADVLGAIDGRERGLMIYKQFSFGAL